jgi:hypothetical protein
MTSHLDPERLARAVAAATGVHLVVEGPCPEPHRSTWTRNCWLRPSS